MPEATKVLDINVPRTLALIKSRLKRADTIFEDHQYNMDHDADQYYELEEEVAKRSIIDAWIMIRTLFEKFNDQTLLATMEEDYLNVLKNPMVGAMGYEEPYLVGSDKADKLLDMFDALHVKETAIVDYSVPTNLLDVLRKMDNYVTSPIIFSDVPGDENDLHNRIEHALQLIYSDVRHKPPMAKPIKCFDGDTGLPEISTVIEYKYLDSSDKKKRVYEELLADLSGYQCEEYRNIVFVIYETNRFSYESEWKAGIESCNPVSHVEVVLLKGSPPKVPGAREARKNSRLKTEPATPEIEPNEEVS